MGTGWAAIAVASPCIRSSARATGCILEGAFQLLLTRNHERVTIVDLADRSGVNVGMIYQYFSSREGILGALVGRYVEAHLSRVDAAAELLKGAPIQEYLDGLMRVLIRSYAD